MTINKYRANSLKAAIDKARIELGPEAKVVHVRQLDKYAAPGMESSGSDSEKIEIIAAIDDEEEDEPAMDEKNTERQPQRSEYIPTPTPDASESVQERPKTPKRMLDKASPTYDETFLKNLKDRISEEDVVVDEDEDLEFSNDYETWVTRVGTSFRLTERLTFSSYAQHTERYSDAEDLEYTRDTLAAYLTYHRQF